MLKFVGLAMMGIFAMMVIPASFDAADGEHTLWGAATVTQKDATGNTLFTQTVHNRVVDTGEDFLLESTFKNGSANADTVLIGSICISDTVNNVVETNSSSSFDTANGITETNCIEASGATISASTAQIGPLTFSEPTHISTGGTVDGIGICQANGGTTPFNNCGTAGILFALVDTTDTTLNSGETVDITYTFDISSSGT